MTISFIREKKAMQTILTLREKVFARTVKSWINCD